MPNWCECDLTVIGKSEKLKEFMLAVESDQLPLEEKVANRLNNEETGICLFEANKIIPYPEKYRKADEESAEFDKKLRDSNLTEEERKNLWVKRPKDGFNDGGYEWCINNWGTKWGLCDVIRQERPRSLFYTFRCAWSPPLPIIEKASEKFPELIFQIKFFECGAGYKGNFKYSNGKIIKREENDYHGGRGG